MSHLGVNHRKERLKIEEMKKHRLPVVQECYEFEKSTEQCKRISGELCNVYLYPSAKWRLGRCPMATHTIEVITEKQKHRKKYGLKRRNR